MKFDDITIGGMDLETVTMNNRTAPHLEYGTLREARHYGEGWWLFWWDGAMEQMHRHFIGGTLDDPSHAVEGARRHLNMIN